MYHRALLLIIGLLLAGCASPTAEGSASPPTTPTATAASPATVHERFIQALQTNDRETALALVGDIQFKAGIVDTWLQTATSLQRTSGTIGKFIEVRALPPTDEGRGLSGISVWQHETGASCYRASLAQADSTWQVIDWRPMGLGTCPKS